jgi:2-isopropylmalate synthase
MCDRLIIFDTTLRDGEQSPGFSMNLQEKLQMAEQLERLRVDVIEAGFPIASEGDFQSVKEVAGRIKKSSVAGLCRTKALDIDRAWEALQHARKPCIHTFIATSDIHLKYKLRKTHDEVLKDAVWAVKHSKGYCEDVEFSAEDASRSDPKFLIEVFSAAIEAGATVINVPDTVGYSLPWEYAELIQTLMEEVKGIEDVVVSVHCHNDLGLAVANSLQAVQHGARQIECTINGIGERAGNASLEEVAMAIHTRRQDFHCDINLDTTELFPASQLLEKITGNGVQPNKAIVGRNAFAHEAGIHQDGVLKNPLCYEIMTPQSVGIPSNKLVLGKHSGRNALRNRLHELGFEIEGEKLNQVYHKFTDLADKKKVVLDQDITELVQQLNGDKNESVNVGKSKQLNEA